MGRGMETKKNKFIEEWGSVRENLEQTFRWSRRNLALVGIFAIAIPVLVYKGVVKEFKVTVASFPVVFYDGEHESNIGEISIYPAMDFKLFQSILSQTIGISPHQFTVYRVDQNKREDLSSTCSSSPTSPESSRRRTPVTAKVNFAAIIRDKDCLFLVVLKRSRRDRRRKNHNNQLYYYHDDDFMYHQQMMMRFEQEQQYVNHHHLQPNNIVLLRRDTAEDLAANLHMNHRPFSPPYYDTVSTSDYLTDYNNRSVDYYSKCMQINGFSYNDVRVCENCRDAATKGSSPEFHCCFYDPVVPVFKPCVAGVIARPAKDCADL